MRNMASLCWPASERWQALSIPISEDLPIATQSGIRRWRPSFQRPTPSGRSTSASKCRRAFCSGLRSASSPSTGPAAVVGGGAGLGSGRVPRVALRLQVGPGGSGKTRLMIEASRRLEAEHGWVSGFCSSAPDALPKLEALLGSGGNCIVVVDYAETRPGDVVALARAALGERCTGKVRLALVARNAGAWWERLADGKDGILKAVLESPNSKTGPYRIDQERVPVGVRAAVFEEALSAFAARKGMPAPDCGCPNLASDPFGEVLFIHLAALAKLRGQAADGDKELIDHAVGHERAYWRRMLSERGIDEARLDDLEQVIALLTLIGGTVTAKDSLR